MYGGLSLLGIRIVDTRMITNGILSRLSPADFRRLEPHLETVRLPAGKRLERRNRRIDHIFFIERGIASLMADSTGDRSVEVAVVGREGMTGVAAIMGAERSPYEMFVQLEGEAHCMSAANLLVHMEQSAGLRGALLRYAHAFLVQIASTALANGRGNIEQRLARWLLMAHDRIDGDELPVTHELLAMTLGVRRPGVTDALKLLEKRGFIRTDRRAIIVSDRDGLKKVSTAYGLSESEYLRVLG